jgi:Cft2 family RNA processing exonuclease
LAHILYALTSPAARPVPYYDFPTMECSYQFTSSPLWLRFIQLMPRITFQSLARKNEIGCNSYCLEIDSTRIVLDAGMHPKVEGKEAIPDYGLVKDLRVDAAIITHAHLDHSGSLPLFQREHSEAEIIMTEPTGALVEAMLHNSVNVMQSKREELNMKQYPLFVHGEVDRQERHWSFRRIEQTFSFGPDHVIARFYDAGHILGSVGVLFEHDGKRIFYTGDVQFEDQTMLQGAKFPEEPVDVLIMETTRGAIPRRAGYTRQQEIERLAAAITETLAQGGSVLIPVFALGKTQELLLILKEMHALGLLPKHAPVQIGGLAAKMTGITDKFSDQVRRRHHGVNLLELRDLVATNPKRGHHRTLYAPGRIYALSSGMMTEKTTSNDFAFQFIDNPKNALLMVGYADPDSPAGAVLKAKPGDPVTLDRSLPPLTLRCRVEHYDFSGHAERDSLVAYAKKVAPKKILLVHGDAAALAWFKEELTAQLPNTEIVIPVPGEVLNLV